MAHIKRFGAMLLVMLVVFQTGGVLFAQAVEAEMDLEVMEADHICEIYIGAGTYWYSSYVSLNSTTHSITDHYQGTCIGSGCNALVRAQQSGGGGSHTITTVDTGHAGAGIHGFKKQCSKCGYVFSTYTASCSGPPCIGVNSIGDEPLSAEDDEVFPDNDDEPTIAELEDVPPAKEPEDTLTVEPEEVSIPEE